MLFEEYTVWESPATTDPSHTHSQSSHHLVPQRPAVSAWWSTWQRGSGTINTESKDYGTFHSTESGVGSSRCSPHLSVWSNSLRTTENKYSKTRTETGRKKTTRGTEMVKGKHGFTEVLWSNCTWTCSWSIFNWSYFLLYFTSRLVSCTFFFW